jgi:hypothetical protein
MENPQEILSESLQQSSQHRVAETSTRERLNNVLHQLGFKVFPMSEVGSVSVDDYGMAWPVSLVHISVSNSGSFCIWTDTAGNIWEIQSSKKHESGGGRQEERISAEKG